MDVTFGKGTGASDHTAHLRRGARSHGSRFASDGDDAWIERRTDASSEAAVGETFSGEATYYAADGRGSCGFKATPNDLNGNKNNAGKYVNIANNKNKSYVNIVNQNTTNLNLPGYRRPPVSSDYSRVISTDFSLSYYRERGIRERRSAG